MDRLLNIGIVGGGAIGSALGTAFREAGVSVAYWDIDPARATVGSLAELVSSSPLLLLAIPSWADRPVVKEIAGLVNEDKHPLVVSVSKGVEPGFITIDAILEQGSEGKFDYGLLYGPMLAGEITAGKYGHGVLATNTDKWTHILDIEGVRLTTAYSTDVKSVALSGPLKNIYSVGLGLADGLDVGNNTKGMLTLTAANEMKEVIRRLGGDPGVIDGPAGIADLVTTGWSGLSFNYRAGHGLAVGEITHEQAKSEGVNALKELPAVFDVRSLPMLRSLYEVLIERQAPDHLLSLFKG